MSHHSDLPPTEGDAPSKNDIVLKVPMSTSLCKQIASKAADEGLSVNDLAQHILAEGLHRRAWNVVEQARSSPKAPQHSQPHKRGSHPRNNNRFNKRSGHHRK